MTRLIEILGTGCPRCQALADNAESAARAAGVDYRLEWVRDIDEILQRDVLMTPGLVIDGCVRLVGRVASVEEIAAWLAEPPPGEPHDG